MMGSVRMLWENGLNFVYRERFLIGTSLARIGFGIIMLFFYCIHYQQRYFLWYAGGALDSGTYKQGMFTIYQFASNLLIFDILFYLGIIVTIVYILGYKGRVTSVLFFVFTYSILQRNGFLQDGGDNLLRVLLIYMLFTQNTAYFSFDSKHFWRKCHTKEQLHKYRISTLVHNFAVLACIIQMCILYFTAGSYQTMGDLWNQGTALYYIMQVDQFSTPLLKGMFDGHDWLTVIATYLSILVKLAFPFMLFNRKTKYIAVCSIAFFHLGIAVGMGLITFSAIMMIADLMIISDDDYRKLRRGWIKMKTVMGLKIHSFFKKIGQMKGIRMQEITVFYDGWCPFCTKTKRNIQKIDVFRLVNFVSFRDDCVISEYKFSIEALEEMIHSKKGSEPVKVGIYSFIQISKRVVPMWGLLPFLYLSVWCGFGQKLYKFIANRRIIIPSGSCNMLTGCQVKLTRQKEHVD
ncbi:DCC1-like thiol-disulfide oxidoreductase family protein [Bacillus wiedmannii]|uniref:DCC1-like thiol-disulfide oxidoreductase family protein n=1 Tax=Bacillus wiedmannii TaxID=1890302 RepID=UPI000BECC06A|nr:DCC1-like thiol-disulfide oxidoreductase family protein [Bacillus wiedmannii]PDZ42315.1 gamma-carboxylase [Bacillus wiedmannii]